MPHTAFPRVTDFSIFSLLSGTWLFTVMAFHDKVAIYKLFLEQF